MTTPAPTLAQVLDRSLDGRDEFEKDATLSHLFSVALGHALQQGVAEHAKPLVDELVKRELAKDPRTFEDMANIAVRDELAEQAKTAVIKMMHTEPVKAAIEKAVLDYVKYNPDLVGSVMLDRLRRGW